MEGYDYEAAAGTIKIEDLTTDRTNREILRRLKDNDPGFVEMWVMGDRQDNCDYCPEGALDSEWLGYFIGRNTKLKDLAFWSNPFKDFSNSDVETFCTGVNSNRSIQKIHFHNTDLSGGEIFQSLGQLFEKNGNLSKLVVDSCTFGAGCARQLSMTLKGCSKSLKHLKLRYNQMGGEQLVDIIDAMSTHPQLEKIELPKMNIGRHECTALADLLRVTFSELRTLSLYNNGIDDEGVDALAGALVKCNLSVLDLSYNFDITARSCQSLASLLENPNSNLEELRLYRNNIGNEGARNFADALASNNKLTTLGLNGSGITAEGYSSFAKVLCDTSSINNTFLSNHTLESLGGSSNIPADVRSALALNKSSEDKRQVAIKKILKHHRHFDMQPFFEWDLKVLPIAINWFERARAIDSNNEAQIDKRKLEAIYQFIRAVPEVFEPAPAAGEKRKRSALGT